ncbi:hypothetical protein BDN71DRAFT_1454826, partial [Pleurotus eryngii]
GGRKETGSRVEWGTFVSEFISHHAVSSSLLSVFHAHMISACALLATFGSPWLHIDTVSSALTKTHSSEPSALAAVDTYTVASVYQLVDLTQGPRQHSPGSTSPKCSPH